VSSACIQSEALKVSLFLYREVLHQDLGPIDALRAKNSKRLPSAPTKNDLISGVTCLPWFYEPDGLCYYTDLPCPICCAVGSDG